MGAMAYDEVLAGRVRELVGGDPDVTEMRMFGGLAFLAGGNMAAGASGQGGLMVRVRPEETDALVAQPGVRPFEMRGRPLDGWVRVDADAATSDRDLEAWVERGVAHARSLPPKGQRRAATRARFPTSSCTTGPYVTASAASRGGGALMSTATTDPPSGTGWVRCLSSTGPTRHVHERGAETSTTRAGTGTTPSSRAAPRAPASTSGSPRPQAPRRCGAHRDQRAGRAMSAQASSDEPWDLAV